MVICEPPKAQAKHLSTRALLNHEYLLQYIDPKCQGQLYFLDLLETSTCLPQEITFRSCAENWSLFWYYIFKTDRERKKTYPRRKLGSNI